MACVCARSRDLRRVHPHTIDVSVQVRPIRVILDEGGSMTRTLVSAELARRCAGIVLFGLAVPPIVLAQIPAQRQVVDIAVEDKADLWSRRDGTGYANDIVRAAFAAAGVEARLHVLPYARCKRIVSDATVVACLSMS